MYYLLEVSFCWLVSYCLYAAFLRKETFFESNRLYLLGCTVMGVIIPCIEIPLRENNTPLATIEHNIKNLTEQSLSEVYISLEQSGQQLDQALSINVYQVLLILYILGCLFMFGRFMMGVAQIRNLYASSANIQKRQGYHIVETQLPHIPFSFFNYLFIYQKEKPPSPEQQYIFAHELAHIKGFHTFDVILFEVLKIFFWFNPLVYLYQKSLRDIHEFLADKTVLQKAPKSDYGRLLIQQSAKQIEISLANNFNHSQLKKRINMMTSSKSSRWAYSKYALVFPLFLFLSLAVCQTDALAQGSERLSKSTMVVKTPENKTRVVTLLEEDEKNSDGDVVYKDPQTPALFGSDCESLPTKREKWHCSIKAYETYVYENIEYPKVAKAKGITGQVIVEFEIGKNGQVQNAKAVKAIGGGCEEEALRVLNEMPGWTPAQQDGKNVVSFVSMLIEFEPTGKALKRIKNGSNKPTKSAQLTPYVSDCTEGEHGDRWLCSQKRLDEILAPYIEYPEAAQKWGIWGSVGVAFQIDKNGNTTGEKIQYSNCPPCNDKALEIIKQQNIKWYPLHDKDGKAISASFGKGITFVPKMGTKTTDGAAYILVDEMPHPKICQGDTGWKYDDRYCTVEYLRAFFKNNMRFPTAAKAAKVHGVAIVNATINEQGQITDAKILRGLGHGADEEALRLVRSLPAFQAGKHQGKVVKVKYNFYIPFLSQ